MYPHDESAAFHLPAVYRNARRCRVNDAIAENYTRRGRASYSYTLESLSGIIHYSLIMIFAAFFVFFPPFFRSPAGATTMTKCVLARPCETVEEVKGQTTELTTDALTTYRSRLPSFFESPSYLLVLDIRSFPALLLNININLGSTEKVLRSLVVLSSSVFTSSRFNVCVSVLPCAYIHLRRSVCKKKIFAARYQCSYGKIDLSPPLPLPTLYSLLPATKEFSIWDLRQTDWKLVYSIFCSNNVMLYDFVCDWQPRFSSLVNAPVTENTVISSLGFTKDIAKQ